MSRFVKGVLAANLLVLAVLVFVYPHLMVSPGKLIPGHKGLEADCFACHTSFRGAASERCAGCHKPAEIGRLTTTGQPIVKPLAAIPFHQKLSRNDCVACHSDHSGVRRFRQEGRFNHALLQVEERRQCEGCHSAPKDPLHRQITGNCTKCHGQEKWTPATFDHDKYFLLDHNHDARCATCHPRNDYSRYTCYGCHEHSLFSIRGEHVEEGIRDFDDCVECHRSGDEHDIRYRGRDGRGGKKEDDD